RASADLPDEQRGQDANLRHKDEKSMQQNAVDPVLKLCRNAISGKGREDFGVLNSRDKQSKSKCDQPTQRQWNHNAAEQVASSKRAEGKHKCTEVHRFSHGVLFCPARMPAGVTVGNALGVSVVAFAALSSDRFRLNCPVLVPLSAPKRVARIV